MSTPKKRNNYLLDAWLVIVLALLYGTALAAVQVGLSQKIAQNQLNETYSAIPKLIEGADSASTEKLDKMLDGKTYILFKAKDSSRKHLGWVMPTEGQGFADKIKLLISLNPDMTELTGIYVLDQKETPGLGNYITEDYFQKRFQGKPTDKALTVVKREAQTPEEVQAITGATVSSDSVIQIVNQAIKTAKSLVPEIQQNAPTA